MVTDTGLLSSYNLGQKGLFLTWFIICVFTLTTVIIIPIKLKLYSVYLNQSSPEEHETSLPTMSTGNKCTHYEYRKLVYSPW